ncbi:DUF4174 domain-containing protein [Ensifer soli]|uniref:DUF4174 domain-containing protein n=1 Tax=Ciceribacter sp. sgz301302 TaxID=3342379 RepID=UPI0035B8C7D2
MKMIVTVMLASFFALPAVAAPLAELQWKNRALVIFADTADPAFQKQKDMLKAEEPGLSERQLVVIHVDGETAETLAGADDYDGKALRAALSEGGRATSFELVLIGKDGTVKLRRGEPVAMAELFGVIDAMPMRAGEAGQ